jgi:phosphoglycerol geranylgeranyltransferase
VRMKGKVRNYLKDLLNEGRALHFSLIDPAKLPKDLYSIARKLCEAGTSGFLVGGTLGVTVESLNETLEVLEGFDVPKIIFPSNINLLSPKADAILFLSLLNSDDLYFVVGAQVSSSLMVKKFQLESLPTAYLIVGNGGTASHVGRARPIPFENHELALAYASAAELMGMEYVYLEAGSGSPETVRPEMVQTLSRSVSSHIIVGGGIRSPERARELVKAGAEIIVTGNLIEENADKALKIIEATRKQNIGSRDVH